MPRVKSSCTGNTPNHGVRRVPASSSPSTQHSRPHGQTPTPISNDHLYGLIMWLPPGNEVLPINESLHAGGTSTAALCGPKLPIKCYDHPVLVLSPIPKSTSSTSIASPTQALDDAGDTETVTILIITSFGGEGILKKYPRPLALLTRQRVEYHLPIWPASPHPDLPDVPVLRLKDGTHVNGREMDKKSYVNLQNKHRVPLRALRGYQCHTTATTAPSSDRVGGAGAIGSFQGQNESGTGRWVLTEESYLLVVERAGFVVPTVVSAPAPTPVPPPLPVVVPRLGDTTTGSARPRRMIPTCTPGPGATIAETWSAARQPLIPPTTAAERLGLQRHGDSASSHGDYGTINTISSTSTTSSTGPRLHVASPTLGAQFQAERVPLSSLNPGRGTSTRTGYTITGSARTQSAHILPLYWGHGEGTTIRVSGYLGHDSHQPSYMPFPDRPPARGDGKPSTRAIMIGLCVGLGILAGTGYGLWAAWVYRAAIGRGLLAAGGWIIRHGWALIKALLRFGWRVLAWVGRWLGGLGKGVAGWGWEKLKGLFAALV